MPVIFLCKMPTTKPKKNKNPRDGTTIDGFLEAEGITEEIQPAALGRRVNIESVRGGSISRQP